MNAKEMPAIELDQQQAKNIIKYSFNRTDVSKGLVKMEKVRKLSGYFIGNDNLEKIADIEPTQEQLKRAIEKYGTKFNPSIQISKH
ncbi:MAG: hypothetical protein PUG48_05710 [Clostridia bacterium]|nr:hypothetical protein [Clostridia bacterium]